VPPSEVIGKTYKLTPTELRVLRAIVNVGGVRQVAGNLGIADTTVKTHLGRLFEKTGVSRQADLVKLVAGYSSGISDLLSGKLALVSRQGRWRAHRVVRLNSKALRSLLSF